MDSCSRKQASQWILEFLVRNPATEDLAKSAIAALHLPLRAEDEEVDPCLKKALLLRTIECELHNALLSEDTLEALVLLDDLDARLGLPPGDAIRAAYCSVALDCTVRLLVGAGAKPGSEYLDAINRIWGPRVSRLSISDLSRWEYEVNAAVWDAGVREKLMALDTRTDTVAAVTAYLKEARALEEKHGTNAMLQNKCVSPPRLHRGPVEISSDIEEPDIETSGHVRNSFLSTELENAQEELRSSCLELQRVVVDPLPEALQVSETVIADLAAEKNVDIGNPSCGKQDNVSPPSLMTRNSTAHTEEWSDSIECSPEAKPIRRTKLNLPSPKTRVVSPLEAYEPAKISKRRKVRKWNLLEEDTLRNAVQRFGRGNWKVILNSYRDTFVNRTEVDLKDKWRNMTK